MREKIIGVAGGALLMSAMPALAQDETQIFEEDSSSAVTVSSGFVFSSGKYGGTQNTDIQAALMSVSYSQSAFMFSAALPYISINSPSGGVIGGGGTLVGTDPNAGSGSTTRAGFGDLSLSATYSLPSTYLSGFDMDIMGQLKLPTADASKGLSTGKTDFGFSVDISRAVGNWLPFVTLGYQIPGQPDDYSLRNIFSFSGGGIVPIGEQAVVMISYDADISTGDDDPDSSSIADSHQIFTAISYLFTDAITLTGFSEIGLSEGAPGFGAGLLVSWKVL
jgi:hypothetical protein